MTKNINASPHLYLFRIFRWRMYGRFTIEKTLWCQHSLEEIIQHVMPDISYGLEDTRKANKKGYEVLKRSWHKRKFIRWKDTAITLHIHTEPRLCTSVLLTKKRSLWRGKFICKLKYCTKYSVRTGKEISCDTKRRWIFDPTWVWITCYNFTKCQNTKVYHINKWEVVECVLHFIKKCEIQSSFTPIWE